MAVGFSKPHLPFVAPKKYWDLYPEESISGPIVTDKPNGSSQYTMRNSGELTSYYGVPNRYDKIDEAMTKTLRRAYYACVSYVDAQIGKLLDQLENSGVADNTIVVLWGDHGYKLGDYGSWCKWSNMNIDTNIPLIFRVPGEQMNKVCRTPVEALDIYPTLADLCGLDRPDHLQGKSLVGNLRDPEKFEDNIVSTVWAHQRHDYKKTVIGYSAKDHRFNYVEWVNLSTGEVLAKEFYDHHNDPMETRNIIKNPEYKSAIVRLREKVSSNRDLVPSNVVKSE
jgi:iduronate 2-sulfatase